VSIVVSLQMPLQIWASSTRDERDSFFLSAGFKPELQTVDAGSDGQTVRFTQVDVLPHLLSQVTLEKDMNFAAAPVSAGPQAGDDLRDFQAVSIGPVAPGTTTDEFGEPVAGTAMVIAGRALKLILGGGGGRLTAAIWNSLPSFVQTVLIQVGIGIGALIAFSGDIPFITLPGQGGDFDPSQEGGAIIPTGPAIDIQIGAHPDIPGTHLGAHVIGKWNTNPKNPALGVTFYRLSNGWLAVKKKNGSWKTWKPKKPIVLYANGASNLKTMLRADKALNKQAKAIAGMLNRRAPRKKSSPSTSKPGIIIESGPGNIISRT